MIKYSPHVDAIYVPLPVGAICATTGHENKQIQIINTNKLTQKIRLIQKEGIKQHQISPTIKYEVEGLGNQYGT